MRHSEFAPFTTAQREGLIALSINRPQRNIFGDLGPRCPTCSGLGAYLRLGGGDAGVTKATSKCGCDGSGIDLVSLERDDREAMWRRIRQLESALKLPITSKHKMPPIKMSRQFWMECIAWATVSGTAVASSTTETIATPNIILTANYMQDGRRLRLRGHGAYGTTATPTLTYAVRWGGVSGTVLAKSFAAVLTSGVGGGASMTAIWDIEILIQTRANGSSGSLFTGGEAKLYTGTAPTAGTVTHYGMPVALASGATGGTTPVAVTADLTADTALSLTVLWGTNNAANSVQTHDFSVESCN